MSIADRDNPTYWAVRAIWEREGPMTYQQLADRCGISRSTAKLYATRSLQTVNLRMACARKVRHSTEIGAMATLLRMRVKKASERERSLAVYACDNCGGWHLGHPYGEAYDRDGQRRPPIEISMPRDGTTG